MGSSSVIHVLFMDMFPCFQLKLLFCLGVWILQVKQLFHEKVISIERITNCLVSLLSRIFSYVNQQ
jgi:hypothetical protein